MEFALILLALVVSVGIAFAVVVLVTGDDPGLLPASADGLPVDLPTERPLRERDVTRTRFDTGLRGYRTSQVDEAMARLAYDVGFKDELIRVLASEVTALRAGRHDEAEALRLTRMKALGESARADDSVATPDRDPAGEPARRSDSGEPVDEVAAVEDVEGTGDTEDTEDVDHIGHAEKAHWTKDTEDVDGTEDTGGANGTRYAENADGIEDTGDEFPAGPAGNIAAAGAAASEGAERGDTSEASGSDTPGGADSGPSRPSRNGKSGSGRAVDESSEPDGEEPSLTTPRTERGAERPHDGMTI